MIFLRRRLFFFDFFFEQNPREALGAAEEASLLTQKAKEEADSKYSKVVNEVQEIVKKIKEMEEAPTEGNEKGEVEQKVKEAKEALTKAQAQLAALKTEKEEKEAKLNASTKDLEKCRLEVYLENMFDVVPLHGNNAFQRRTALTVKNGIFSSLFSFNLRCFFNMFILMSKARYEESQRTEKSIF